MIFRQKFQGLLLLATLLLSLMVNSVPVIAQSKIIRWSPPQRIPGYFDRTLPPYLIADQNRTVHAFTSQKYGEGSDSQVIIVYNRWTMAQGWTKPVDILISPVYEARIMGVLLDQSGIMHLLFFGGNDNGATMYYAQAAAVNAGQAPAWSVPLPIGDNAITPSVAGLADDNKGHLVVVYNGNQGEGNSLYAVYSNNNGLTWSTPSLVWSTFSTELWPNDLQMSFGASGQLHAVWNYVDKLGKNVAGYYAYLADIENPQWSEPVEFDKSLGLGIAVPSVTEYRGEVYVLYNNGMAAKTAPVLWVRHTQDNGRTWSNPVRPFPNHIGRNGGASIVVDSKDNLHIFFGQRTNDGKTDIHGMWHSMLRNDNWVAPQPVVSGPLVQGTDDNAFDPGDARAIVSQGNVLLVTWRTDPGNGVNGVWYASTQLDIPELPTVPLPVPKALFTPTPIATAAIVATPTATPSPTPVTVVFDNSGSASSHTANNAAGSLFAGMIPVIMLLVSFFVVTKARRSHA